MKTWAKIGLTVMLVFLLSVGVFAEKGEDLIIPLYAGSEIRFDDFFGFEEFSFVLNESTILTEEGYLRRLYCLAPIDRSPFEILKNYEQAIKNENGTVLFRTRKPQEIRFEEGSFRNIFGEVRKSHGSAYNAFPYNITEYLVARLNIYEKEFYIILAAGRGELSERDSTFYELVFLEMESMKMGMITQANIATRLEDHGKIAIYELLFETGESEIKADSAPALQVIAEYLNANQEQKVIIVGHTDNVGDFDFNLKLSQERANTVVARLSSDYGVNPDQMKPFGAGPVAPVASNDTEEGRAKNRRVEMVKQ